MNKGAFRAKPEATAAEEACADGSGRGGVAGIAAAKGA